MNILSNEKKDESKILKALLTQLSITCPNLTIIIDEANLAFDPFNTSDDILNKVKADLQVFTMLTKETKKVRFVSSSILFWF